VLLLALAVAFEAIMLSASPSSAQTAPPATAAGTAPVVRDASAEATPPPAGVDQTLVLEPTEVRGRRLDEVPDSSAFATVIPVERESAEGGDVADLLSEVPGVQVRRYGGLGDFSTMSIRGSTPGQVRIFFDGVPLTRARSDVVNLSDLPLDQLDRIEVYRGVSPLSVSASALAGVVNLISRDPSATPSFSLLAGGGSFGTRKVSASGSAKSGDLGAIVSTTYLGSQGNFPFEDDNGTLSNPNDDEVVDRKNNAFNSGEALTKLVYPIDDANKLSLLNDFYANSSGVPGIGAFQSTDAHLFELRNLSYLRWDTAPNTPFPLGVQTTAYVVYGQQDFDDPLGQVGLGRQDTHNQTYATGVGSEAQGQIGAHDLQARLDVGGEIFAPENLLTPQLNEPDQSRLTIGVGIGDTWGVFDDLLLIQPQFRYEHANDFFGGLVGPGGIVETTSSGANADLFTPRLGLTLNVRSDLALKANGGRYARLPTFGELFGNQGSVIGNPNLKPETGVNADVGFLYTPSTDGWGPLDKLRVESALFLSEVDDLIVFVQNSQRTSVPRNVASTRTWGIELGVTALLWEQIGVAIAYTHQDARDLSGIPGRDGNQIPGQPANDLYLRIDWLNGIAQPYYELAFLADNYLDQANFLLVPARAIQTTGLTVPLPRWGLEATVEVRNFTNNQVEDVAGYPLPGISVFGSLRWRWSTPSGDAA
jgi:iron complex outermembrane receptor protein